MSAMERLNYRGHKSNSTSQNSKYFERFPTSIPERSSIPPILQYTIMLIGLVQVENILIGERDQYVLCDFGSAMRGSMDPEVSGRYGNYGNYGNSPTVTRQ